MRLVSLCVLKLTLVPIPWSERMSPHCGRKVGGEEQSELYKHIKRAVGHGEGKAKQKAANQEGDHERNQRPSITQRQDGKTSMCAC